MSTQILEYVKNRKGQRVGVFVAAVQADGNVQIGWSKCHGTKDKWNRERGIEIASRRAKSGTNISIPEPLNGKIDDFVERARRYFKDRDIVITFIKKSRMIKAPLPASY
ncbi:hypothetical protein CMI47_11080 [Candidatus Pacearchaeota archaeon]|nr:hypothetical protein [Candidatus Pacearchaeota archaeon]